MDLSHATVAQLMLPVTEVERAVVYYRDILGLPFLFSAPPQMAFFQCGDVRLLIGVPEAAAHRQRGGTAYFRVEDIQAVHATLSARGVAFQVAPHVVHRGPGSDLWLAEFQDPDGNQLALMADVPSAPAPERTG